MQPAQGIKFVHIAICREAQAIEAQADTSESPAELAALGDRLAMFHQINKLHTDGEEVSMYADLEQKLPHVRGAYLHDHHDDHELFQDLAAHIKAASTATGTTRADAVKKMRRQAIALTEHVLPHVHKEDTLITPLIVELFTPAEQGAQIGRMMGGFPPEVMARTMPWMIGHLDADDRVAYVAMMQKVQPPERFTVACGWIKSGIGADAWAPIASRVPGCPT
jgi:hemerythrin-like domain-containing protein